MNDNLSLTVDMFPIDKDEIAKDILTGQSLEIILLLLAQNRTSEEISRILNIPIFTTQVYLARLLNSKLIKVNSISIIDGKLEKVYSLGFKDLSILNSISSVSDKGNKENTIIANNFSSLVNSSILGLNNNKDKPHKIKAYFMNTDLDKMAEFENEIEAVFKKYKQLECEDGCETYSFFTVLAPCDSKDSI